MQLLREKIRKGMDPILVIVIREHLIVGFDARQDLDTDGLLEFQKVRFHPPRSSIGTMERK